MSTVFAFIGDEVKTIGQGFRQVYVRSLGRKWAYLTEVSTDTNFRLPLQKWKEIEAQSVARLEKGGMSVFPKARRGFRFKSQEIKRGKARKA